MRWIFAISSAALLRSAAFAERVNTDAEIPVTPPAYRILRFNEDYSSLSNPAGRTDWFDPASGRPLLLLYLDRAATISGRSVVRGKPLRYAIQAAAPGYVWVGQQSGADENVYAVTPRPARLLLAVTPLETGLAGPSVRPTAASPAHTDTAVR